MIQNLYKYITVALLFVSFATIAQTPTTITKDGNYTVTGSETLTATHSIMLKPNSWIKPGSIFYATVIPDAYISPTLSATENYVFTRAFQAPITETELNDPSIGIKNNKDVIENITYFDGLGRAKQQIGIKASPYKKDIITHIIYDDYGRQDKQYLPFERGDNIPLGSFNTVNVNTDINAYYQSKYQTDFDGMTQADINAYNQSIFEASPLNRVLEQGAPGKAWKANDTNTDHTIKFDWDTNVTDEVIYFKVEFPLVNGNPDTEAPTLAKDGFYGLNQLYITIIKDENWKPGDGNNHTSKEYKDKLGRVILKRAYNSSSPSTGGSPEGDGGQHNTYYVYDDFGNLSYVIPPKVTLSDTDGVSTTELNELCYQYKYDYRNRLVEKKIPGKGKEYIIYNKLDQPIMTQDANQRAKSSKEWLFTKYDAFGRVAYTGIRIDNRDREIVQSEANLHTDVFWVVSDNPSMIGGVTMYYDDGGYPSVQYNEALTINYYDNYTFDHNVPNPGTVYGQTVATNAKGLATGTKVRVLDTFDWITTVTYYDVKGRPIYVHSTNEYLNTIDIIETKLDFAGKVLETKTTHTKGNNAPIVTIDTFTYDHMSRLLDQKQTINNQASETILVNTYDALGQLETKAIGGGLQEVDYTYNIRGWLTNINNDTKDDNDLFSFSIKYNDIVDVTKKLYNGNISKTSWSTAGDNTTNNPVSNSYTYSYDALNRISSAIDNTGNYNLTSIEYDKNGNILNLQRMGHTATNATNFGVMDNLEYKYSTGNQLEKVTDSADKINGFKDGTNIDDDYIYDVNGNLTADKNKGVDNIEYNHLNLPTEIRSPLEYAVLKYTYDAVGNKLRKTLSRRFGDVYTEYSGNYVYERGTDRVEKLKFIHHPEGYAEPKDENDLSKGFDYIYQYKDHLGNIRLSYADKDNDGKIDIVRNDVDIDGDNDNHMEILEEKNYYPFGLQHKGYNNTITGLPHNYSFNGKEFDQSLNMNTFDLGARHYDPAIGRFMVMDPMTDFFNNQSPYVMANNNPVGYVDLYGFGIWNWLKAVGRHAVNGVKKLFSGNTCDCSSSGDSLAQAWRRPDNIFPERKKRRRRNRRKATSTTSVVNNSPNIPDVKTSIEISPLVLGAQQLPELGIVNPRPPRIPKVSVPTPPRNRVVDETNDNVAAPIIDINFNIPFKPSTTYLKDEAGAVKILSDLIKTLKEYPQMKVIVEGTLGAKNFKVTPNLQTRVKVNGGVGPAEWLTGGRAHAIIKILEGQGVNPQQLIKGKGIIGTNTNVVIKSKSN